MSPILLKRYHNLGDKVFTNLKKYFLFLIIMVFYCAECPKKFISNSGLWKHKEKYHPQKNNENEKKIYICRFCPKQYTKIF